VRGRLLRGAVVVAVVLLVGLALGAGTATAQGGPLGSLVNSAGPWALVAFLLALPARRASAAAACGALALVSLLAGYVLAARLEDHPSSRSLLLFWGLAAVLVGPLLGLGAAWLRARVPVRSGLGAGGLAGVLVGEGVYGLTTVAATTSAAYWAGEAVLGALLLALALGLLTSARDRLVAVAVTALVAAALVVVFRADLIALL
jgi:Family of unknown function (DUF6518)